MKTVTFCIPNYYVYSIPYQGSYNTLFHTKTINQQTASIFSILTDFNIQYRSPNRCKNTNIWIKFKWKTCSNTKLSSKEKRLKKCWQQLFNPEGTMDAAKAISWLVTCCKHPPGHRDIVEADGALSTEGSLPGRGLAPGAGGSLLMCAPGAIVRLVSGVVLTEGAGAGQASDTGLGGRCRACRQTWAHCSVFSLSDKLRLRHQYSFNCMLSAL